MKRAADRSGAAAAVFFGSFFRDGDLEVLEEVLLEDSLLEGRPSAGFVPVTGPGDCRIWSDGRRTAFVYHGTREVNIHGGR